MAVNATFDRARAAIANGGIPEPELDWLLRTADKFCAPKLCLDARPLESMVVLQDWRGRSFDQIATELEARWARLEEERRRLTPWRRVLGAFNLGPAISWVKGVLGGLGAVKATAAAVALLGAISVVGTPLGTKLHSGGPGDSHATPTLTTTTPSTSLPAITLPSTTLPSTNTSTLPTTTLPSVDTSAVPTVSTPTVSGPSTSTPSTQTVTTPSVSVPTVTTPSVPRPPSTSTTVPAVTVPLG